MLQAFVQYHLELIWFGLIVFFGSEKNEISWINFDTLTFELTNKKVQVPNFHPLALI